MKIRSMFLVVLLAVCQVGFAQQQERKLQQISEHVWSYAGITPMTPANSFGANAGIIIGEKSVLVVETLVSANEGKKLLADIRQVTQLPIKWVVNTHYHLDHAWGNCVFAQEKATIIGAGNSPELLAEDGAASMENVEQFGLTKDDMVGTTVAPATVSFNDEMTIDLGGITVQLHAFKQGHCPDNLVVWVPQEKVIFTGDLLFVGCYPFVGEGDVAVWLNGLDYIASLKAQKIIPGHGKLATAADIDQMKTYIKAFDENATKLCAGKTAADAPELAKKIIEQLPKQNRTDLANMVDFSLMMKYLPQAETKPAE